MKRYEEYDKLISKEKDAETKQSQASGK